MQEAGHKPGISAYDTLIDSSEALVKSLGQDVSRETLVDTLKAQGFDPGKRLGFAPYAGIPMEQNLESIQRISSSPLVAAMEEGYDSTKGLQIGSPTSISTRSNRLPAVALDLDKTIFKATPEMQAAEDKALKFLKMNPEANLSLRAEAWGDWEKLAVGNLEANNEMLGFVKQLQDSGISMNVMTARSARVQEKTLGLLGKMDFIPDEVFFRPYTLEGEMEAAEKMKVGWIKKTSDKFDYISIFDDSQKTVTAALKAGVPSALQPSAGAIDRKFLQGSLERGLETMQATFSQDPNQLTRGISELENLIDMGVKRTTGRMLGAASEASAAVAGGIQKSGILRNAAAAATILGKRI